MSTTTGKTHDKKSKRFCDKDMKKGFENFLVVMSPITGAESDNYQRYLKSKLESFKGA
jgi:hypothetical protein